MFIENGKECSRCLVCDVYGDEVSFPEEQCPGITRRLSVVFEVLLSTDLKSGFLVLIVCCVVDPPGP